MDLFDNDSSDSDGETSVSESLSNLAFIHILICKPTMKATSAESVLQVHRKVATAGPQNVTSLFSEKLRKTQFKDVTDISNIVYGHENSDFDIVVNFDAFGDSHHFEFITCGGTYMTLCPSADFESFFPAHQWNTQKASRIAYSSPSRPDEKLEFVVIQKRAYKINTLGAVYWADSKYRGASKKIPSLRRNKCTNVDKHSDDSLTSTDDDNSHSISSNKTCDLLNREFANLDGIVVDLSLVERRLGVFSDASHAKAVSALQNFGMCIIPRLFSKEVIMEWGAAAVSDMESALKTLRTRGIDLLKPGDGGPKIENFHELSMRDPLRCDLRNGHSIKALSARSQSCEKKNCAASDEKSLKTNSIGFDASDIRHHPALLKILHETLNPPPSDPRDQLGNWGLWNFEGKGPEAGPPDCTVGQVGVVMSLPGCADQTIHADTAHLYVHTQLPPHYVNLFMPAVAAHSPCAEIEVGQTAFVLGSHQLRVSAHIMNEEGGQDELEKRLVRPHLQAGDCLLFDCRILHFGLANQYGTKKDGEEQCKDDQVDGWRPLLYINYHQNFFHDPKNWNDRERLFD
jgi:Phytanoyl-CoA dioxygenase (PhyH)